MPHFYQQQTLQTKTKTVTIDLQKRKFGWLCYMHYRGKYLSEAWGQSAQEALTAAEKSALLLGFTHAAVQEWHPDGRITYYRSKIDGQTLQTRWPETKEKQ